MGKDFLTLEDSVRHTFMSVVWSHKIQEKQADILMEKFKCFETIRILCASATSVGLITMIFADQFIIKIISTFISFISTAISLFFKSFDTQESIAKHKKAAVELLNIREKFRVLLVKIKLKNSEVSDLVINYEDLIKQLGQIYMNAPNTTEKSVKRASKALKIKKDNEFTDEEIDLNLPDTLKRS